MSDNRNQPKEYDAVLGSQNSTPVNAMVLGGIAGVKSRLTSPIVAAKITALSEAMKYGEAGLDLIIKALQDESMQVKFAAYSLLKDRDDLQIKPQFQDYLPTFEFEVITVNSQGRQISRIKSFARVFPEDLGNGIILEMVYIPGGTFIMGSPKTESKDYVANHESPQHQVTVPTFYAGKYPITQAQWLAVMGNNPSIFKGEKRPVEMVSWDEAVEFCRKLSEKTGKSYRLLSEAEWEYACRARTSTPFSFGFSCDWRVTKNLANHFYFYDGPDDYWCHRNCTPSEKRPQATTDVGSYPPNLFGLYDMHGNVWEWCSDKFHFDYDDAPNDGNSWETGTDDCRVKRGGSWREDISYCRSAASDGCLPDSREEDIGFRVAVVFAQPAVFSSVL
ncbi:MAG: formylglycine-generating enzyme family protein [Richelia sp. CSU_2_1]|nr:formylglycine-generating enzyme family protein [Microcoleus sp. SU_5_6]NJR25106.1 formylglycine-generating enzyme family protein [Richelia sp. CSU_2_1]